VLASDMSRQVSDVSQSLLTRVFTLEQKVPEQEQRIATLEKHLLSMAQTQNEHSLKLDRILQLLEQKFGS
jgi:uncharacterized coiled-coil protein SlyX